MNVQHLQSFPQTEVTNVWLVSFSLQIFEKCYAAFVLFIGYPTTVPGASPVRCGGTNRGLLRSVCRGVKGAEDTPPSTSAVEMANLTRVKLFVNLVIIFAWVCAI